MIGNGIEYCMTPHSLSRDPKVAPLGNHSPFGSIVGCAAYLDGDLRTLYLAAIKNYKPIKLLIS